MTQKEKKQVRYSLAMSNPFIKNAVEKNKNFYEIDFWIINILDDYAEIFCIKSTEVSRARKLYTQLLEVHEERPF